MSFAFDLTTEGWIPCRMNDGTQTTLSLRDALTEAARMTEIMGDSPPVTIALHRLLLAVLHRCYMEPRTTQRWRQMRDARAFDAERIDDYFARHRSRFDLFNETRPFYQTAAISYEQQGTVARLYFQGDANATLFDHSIKDNPPALTPAHAARLIVAFQAFDVGGLKSFEVGKTSDKSADAAPLLQSAVALARGANLFETLMLNLHRYDGANGEPFTFDSKDDLPAWERDAETQPRDRAPDGYVDLLTWQIRRLRLRPEHDANGGAVVRNVVIMKGYQFPDGFERHGKETMVAFRNNPNATAGQRAWNPLGFNEDKALWRDSLSLFQASEATRTRPKMLDWLTDLTTDDALDAAQTLRIDFLGLAADQAKLLFWRHEQLALPLIYLRATRDGLLLRRRLGEALERADQIADALTYGSKTLATLLLSANADLPNARQPDKKKDVNPLAASFRLEAFYWSRLENKFKQLMIDLPHDTRTEEHGGVVDVIYGEREIKAWVATLRKTASDALKHATRSLDASARNLKAAVQAERTLERELRERLREYAAAAQHTGEAA